MRPRPNLRRAAGRAGREAANTETDRAAAANTRGGNQRRVQRRRRFKNVRGARGNAGQQYEAIKA